MQFEIRDSIAADIEPIAFNIREADANEVAASSGNDVRDVLLYGLTESKVCLTALADDVPFAMLGVGETGRGQGAVWMLATSQMDTMTIRKQFLRKSQEMLALMLSHFPYLHNAVDARNERAIRWLKWLGFDFWEAVEINGFTFYPFSKGEI